MPAKTKPSYAVATGVVQQFPEREVVAERDLNGQIIREFTIKSATSGKLVRVTLGSEFAPIKVAKGSFVSVDGSFTVSEVKGITYYNIWAKELTITNPIAKSEREVLNKSATATSDDDVDTEAAPF